MGGWMDGWTDVWTVPHPTKPFRFSCLVIDRCPHWWRSEGKAGGVALEQERERGGRAWRLYDMITRTAGAEVVPVEVRGRVVAEVCWRGFDIDFLVALDYLVRGRSVDLTCHAGGLVGWTPGRANGTEPRGTARRCTTVYPSTT